MATGKNRRNRAKKKPREKRMSAKSAGTATVSGKSSRYGADTVPVPPGLRLIEAGMSQTRSKASSARKGAASAADRLALLRRAQDIMYDAWESGDMRERIAMAKKALAVSDLCADAWIDVAYETSDIVEARELYERAAAAGKEAVELELGPGAFADYAGDFWRILPTRPYMRAVAGLSDLMWDMGEREESIALIREMLRLNPNDNQGMRSYLISKLFALDDLSEVENLLEIYREPDFAEWHWNMALLTFRREGDSADAASILDQAIEVNPFVPKLLTGATPVPVSMPPQYSLGSPEEAISYAFLNGKNWSDTKGALTWVARKTKGK
ncbi:MAG: hypothetical protein OXH82_04310 [Candidatus Dadabacteria bacterium]|nr:hypothetical protein [Candidatus Dadabacteria bacterium]MDE0663134.1 hypothetical protein [Candidatus Dadabacteria bacterium]